MKVILVDDEEGAIESLQILIKENCPELEIVATANNALEGVNFIHEHKPDIVFLDIQMPGYNGFDVLENIKTLPSAIVFTTAHKDYAIEALRKGAFDYLLKPVDVSELKLCIERAREKIRKIDASNESATHYGIIELSMKEGYVFVKPREIVRLEASGSYTVFYMDGGARHIVSKNLKEFEPILDGNIFYRCHNSHIINLKKVNKFNIRDYCVEMVDGTMVEVAKKNKDIFMEKLKKLNV